MTETALKFGPQWLRDLAHGNSASPPVSPDASGHESCEAPPPPPKYKLAQYRYGREEMLALYCRDLKMPEYLKEFDFLVTEKNQVPLALIPVSDEEQRLWARSVNSDMALRVSGKQPAGPGNGPLRTSRGGSVDRGRGRGRGGYYQRGVSFEDNEDCQPGGFSRLKPMERSQSASEKEQCWDERDRRFERPFAGRGNDGGSSNSLAKDGSRAPLESWRRTDKDDDVGWRTAGGRGGDKFGGRSSWRNHDRDRNRAEYENKDKGLNDREVAMNGPMKNKTQNSRQRTSSTNNIWEDTTNDNLPEWSVEETAVPDVVGTFDSSGAFLETKESNSGGHSEDLYVSDEEDLSKQKEATRKSVPVVPPVRESKKAVENSSSSMSVNVQSIKKSEASESPPNPEKSMSALSVKKQPSDLQERNVSVTFPAKQNSAVPLEQRTSRTLSNNAKEEAVVVVPSTSSSMCDISSQSVTEDDAFAHHKKATENMMAQWTAEEEQRVMSETVAKTSVLDIHHEDAQKWFYRDPQGEIQGPFASSEMCDWFKAGYFTMNLLVRRGCDERFMQLGELMQMWGRIPFLPGNSPPPLRVSPSAPSLATPVSKPLLPNTSAPTQAQSQLTQTDAQVRLMQQQVLQQFMQQQLFVRQAQMQQLLTQLKQQEAFSNLTSQQQNQLVQHLIQQHQQQQVPRPGGIPENPVPTLPFPLMGLTVPSLAKNDLSLWSIPPTSTPGTWPVGQTSNHPTGGIWDTDTPTATPIKASELEKKFAEEEEKRRQVIEAAKRLEEEKKRREEDMRRKDEEERLKELQRHKEEEERRLQELQRLKEEELRRQEEIRRLEELRKEQERKLEELRRQEEERRIEEQRKLEEQRMLEEQQRLAEMEEQRKQAELEEQKRLEAQKREEQRKKEEQKKLKKQEEKRRQEELQAKELERQEMERQKEISKQKELEMKAQKEAEKEKERQLRKEREALAKKEAELSSQSQEPKGPVWNVQKAGKDSNELSLSDIQKLQEKEREEKERIRQQQQQQLMLQQQQQQSLKQAQAAKNGLSWAKRPSNNAGAVKSLAEIQQEEAEKMAQQQKVPKTAASTLSSKVQTSPAAGGSVWGSSSSQTRISSSAPGWNASNCFWDNAVKSTSAQKPAKTTDSAFPALSNSVKPASTNSNKNKNVRAKKDEDAVLKIFETHRKPTDEFTTWCTEALSSLPSLVDVPTFVAFLKDVDSPYEVHDYVRSYLGETKEAQEFSKQFLEKRSKYRNKAKQSATEENMWGPAPALTPSMNKTVAPSIADCDATCTKGKAKKKKNRMQKLDSSMLGFTVQPNPDRINVGEIDHVEGM